MNERERQQPLRVWANRVVQQRLANFERELGRLERSPDADAIHDLRIASRRLRAALCHLEPCFPAQDVGRFRDSVRRLFTLLGEARDLDILMENLARDAARAGSPLAGLVKRLLAQRKEKLRRALPEARVLHRRVPAWRKRLELS